jgi:HEPN domain-containing protein
VSCKQTHQPAEASAYAQQSGVGKLVKAAVGGKLHRREGKTHFPREL